MTRLPALFVSHGSPTIVLDDTPARRFLSGAAASWARPKAILVVSAHWEAEVPTVSTAAKLETIHDFFGFPPALYAMRYPAPGAPELAERAAGLLRAAGIEAALDPSQGLDHGAWTPLLLLYPEADIPAFQLSVESRRDSRFHARLGETLRPLAEEGVLILGTGTVTHDLSAFRRQRLTLDAPPVAYAAAFADWLAETVAADRREALLDWEKAPQARQNHPTPEHFLPFFVALGAGTPGVAGRALHRSYSYGAFAMDTYAFA